MFVPEPAPIFKLIEVVVRSLTVWLIVSVALGAFFVFYVRGKAITLPSLSTSPVPRLPKLPDVIPIPPLPVPDRKRDDGDRRWPFGGVQLPPAEPVSDKTSH
jgi:hypothetical protein